jgi:hypothetical protein
MLLFMILISCGQQKGHAPGKGDCFNNGGCFLFFTQTQVTGNLGGVAGADATCNSDPNKPNDSIYKAVITASTRRACSSGFCATGGKSENLDWALYSDRPYYLADETLVGKTNESGIFKDDLQERIEEGTTFFWLGLNANWTNHAQNCSNWTDSVVPNGGFGDTNDFPSFTTGPAAICGIVIQLLCAEQ